MFHHVHRRRHGIASTSLRALALAGACGLAAGLGGCETDSFLDPSVTGRWEYTPTIVPILERIAAIEDSTGDMVEYSDPVAADLIPDPSEYRIGPGDRLAITLYDDIDSRGQPNVYERDVDIRGTVDLPQLGQISVTNRTVEQTKQVLVQALSRFVNEPLVSVVVLSQRQQTFSVIGAIEQPGPYFISKPDYRLLEALTVAGNFSESSTDEIYIIRQIPLNDVVRGLVPAPGTGGEAPPAATPSATPSTEPTKEPAKDGAKLIDLIDQLSQPKPDKQPDATPNKPAVDPKVPSPSVMRSADPAPLGARRARGGQPPADQPAAQAPKGAEQPPVDLISQPGTQPAAPGTKGPAKPAGSSWVFVHGEWVQIKGAGTVTPTPAPAATPGAALTADQLMTQRVIRVPLQPLLAGLSQYNVVIRPGDVIHIPPLIEGFVYMAGQVARPGPYTLPNAGKMTLIRAIAAAGGLSSIAIPERVDLTRVVGKNRQATIRLDYRAISEGTMPDVYIRKDDVINVGTNFWAYPLAVVRNGFRVSYGFGFVVDRNFADDIFGPLPNNFN